MDRHAFLAVTFAAGPFIFWGTVALLSVCFLVIIFATVFTTVFGRVVPEPRIRKSRRNVVRLLNATTKGN
jgi:predicted membrane protein